MMSSVSIIIDVISYVLIAFVSISLVVSSIMIGIITNISVLERTKEIGILRAIGASKKDISRVFNAETFIIGLTSGVFGVAVTYLLSLLVNTILGALTGIYTLAALPFTSALIMIAVSVALTLISGLIPAKAAAKKDPVIALRTE
jgi:putative ABC transport system permease protein